MILPQFLVIGAQRAGTTWLYKNLREHPQVFMPAQKELEFFSHLPKYALGLEHYAAYFADARPGSVVGEATPSYLWSVNDGSRWAKFPPHMGGSTAERVADTLGTSTRIVVTLRNPIDRALSAMLLHAGYGRIDPAQGVMAVGDQAGIVHMGFYALHLEPWQRIFGSNLLVLVQEVTTDSREETLRRVYEFVGVDANHSAPRTREQSNRGPSIERQEDGAWATIEGRRIRVATAEEIELLREEYLPDVRRLGEVLEMDLGQHWPDFA